ncbi:MAG: uroporphyrinogen decarboxylase [Acidobacteriota bacterium]
MRACRREPAPFTPVWLMRQAGRYLPSYRRLRSKVSMLELCKTPELVSEVTVGAVERIQADAAILFADLLLLVEPLGLRLEYPAQGGPVITPPVRDGRAVDSLQEIQAGALGYVEQAVRQTRRNLRRELPLIGFAGAPFTVASYLVEGGVSRVFGRTKALMHRDPGVWRALMEKLVRATTAYLKGQTAAGVQAVQIFDSWVGCLSPGDYRRFVAPHTARLIRGLAGTVPVIHFGTGTAGLLEELSGAGGEVIGIDWRIDLDRAWERIGSGHAIMGNLDPWILLADEPTLRREVKRILGQAAGRPGHIFNLGHGVLPDTPVESVCRLVDLVHELSREPGGSHEDA